MHKLTVSLIFSLLVGHVYAQVNADTLELPFFDDFHYAQYSPFPSSAFWLDRQAKANCDYAVAPPSIGVIVFDGLDENGKPYSLNSSESRQCDTLTSKAINLDYSPADSIYFSFLFQAKGRGNYPEIEDSIRLEFKSPLDTNWSYVWSKKGEIFPQIARPFKNVLIPIKDSLFLKKGFQFRFRNYASGNGSLDHWLIDYVKIDRFRNKGDSIFDDFAFSNRPKSWLKDYQAIPWQHFLQDRAGYMTANYKLQIQNLRAISSNTTYRYETFDENNSIRDNLLFEPNGPVVPNQEFVVEKPVKYVFESLPVPYSFYKTWHQLGEGGINLGNDSLLYYQDFNNYYALDDGTAEDKVSLVNGNAGGFIAQRFNINYSDTIRSVQYMFNREGDGIVDKPFFVAIWKANSAGNPGDLVYFKTENYPQDYLPENNWETYALEIPLAIQPGNYYVGWIQEIAYRINLGIDRNTDNSNRVYINLNGNWTNNTGLNGTLMIRILVGNENDTIVQSSNDVASKAKLKLYPNPAQNQICIDAPFDKPTRINLFNMTGQMVSQKLISFSNECINIEDLPQGIYLLQYQTNNTSHTAKFIKH
jgi:hypothetical protein